MDIKEMMLNEIKQLSEEKVVEKVEEAITPNPQPIKSKKKRRKKKKVFTPNVEHQQLEPESIKLDKQEEYIKMELNYNNEFDEYKAKVLKEEKFQNLSDYIEAESLVGSEIFSLDEYLVLRKEHDTIKIVLIEPTDSEKERGSISKFYIVKPIYPEEYSKFTREVGPRNLYPDKFRQFALDQGLIYPRKNKDIINKLSSGATFTIYHTIIDISDLNKNVKIFEV